MESDMVTLQDLEKRIQEINYLLREAGRQYFKYPGSVHTYGYASLDQYYNAGIQTPEDIAHLLEQDIWPYAVIGSTSQGQIRCSTNFWLAGYVTEGIKDPQLMMGLRKEGITQQQIWNIRKKQPNTKTLQGFTNMRNKLYGLPQKPLERDIQLHF